MGHMMQIGSTLAVVLVVSAVAGACGGSGESRHLAGDTGTADSAAAASAAPAERRVSNVMIGRRVGPTGRITDPTFQFAPMDTVQVSVGTEGSGGAATLTAAWRSQGGEILQQSTEPIRPAGENTAFHLSQPAGLKPGTYKVIVFLGGDSVDTKVFVVKK